MQSNNDLFIARNNLLKIVHNIINKIWIKTSDAKKFVILRYIDRYLYLNSKDIYEYIDLRTLKSRLSIVFTIIHKKQAIIKKKFDCIEDVLNEKCPICLDDETKNPTTTLCGHAFCQNCILDVFHKSNKVIICCPICRTEIDLFKLKNTELKRKKITSNDNSSEKDHIHELDESRETEDDDLENKRKKQKLNDNDHDL